ncbi:hypothetical protein AB4455_26600 [Vibrio sp. 10N.261.46.E12]|uniref:hypothetical protein n=1 Tax=unclassified Vibrio TaxID=2614977 RepID=UPI0009769D8E|nr:MULTISPECIES: hypothetical protein [unclassified Vibrio]OMO36559.1 hypothetical protein BH584_25665 [Vibrio sp. 10N.261.45.E1]PMJ30956.1 hypothetical protein BCU27_25720 [Vibrio sp. 10N.286.45.B6]PML92282.1 hypothetical protein BCT66_25560 [Vibrio sp. 10N.261.49.E11]PMM66834.1 hypothetical protein BCT48_16510 [Vibrio sp. 10N.261.46.F12]PMM87883.1 hypothetical protein BCT46_25965 [Vibrio sp. 10N.261.46.E8]
MTLKKSIFNRGFEGALHIGDIFGKIAAFVGIPSALLAGTLYWNEILDRFTAPNFTADIEVVEIRCGVILDSDAKIREAKLDFGKVCGEAPLAISFEMLVQNNDTILRTLIDMSVTINSVLLEREISLPVTHIVAEGITNYVKSTSQVPWDNQIFDNGQHRRFEVQFSPILSNSNLKFLQFRDKFNTEPGKVENSSMTVIVSARYAGMDEHIELAKCQVIFEPESVKRFVSKPVGEQVAFVRRCISIQK